jgi:starch synthase
MPMPRGRVLFAASEVYPFAKTGGLADVGYSLPRALCETFDMTVVMPLYRAIDREAFGITDAGEAFDVSLGGEVYRVSLYECTYEGCDYRFVYAPLLCEREYLYGPPGEGYEDNALRFGLFSHAIVRLARQMRSDIVHLNDWQTALAALLIAEDERATAGTVYTIHNLAYQGVFGKENRALLGIGRRHFTLEGVEYYDKVNLMKAGIGFADAVTTVSPTYAQEILTAQFGCGLEGYLHRHRAKLQGIVNGIDTEHFSPTSDTALVRTYASPQGKRHNKEVFLDTAGLRGAEKPLFIFIGRFTWQKGMDLLIEALPKMAECECNIAVLGEGEAQYHDRLEAIADARENVHLLFGYDEALAHRMYAAADFLLMPSLFEPCGLNQLIAAHYGAVPIVHRVGGLADTVSAYGECGTAETSGCGIGFETATCEAVMSAFAEALALFGDPAKYRGIASHNMQADVSWETSAAAYAALYRKISKGALE